MSNKELRHSYKDLPDATKQSMRKANKKWLAKHGKVREAARRVEHNAYVNKRYKENLEWLKTIKSASGCVVCKETDWRCLTFHHVDPTQKEFTISMKVSASKKTLEREVAKCIVLCANCHMKLEREL